MGGGSCCTGGWRCSTTGVRVGGGGDAAATLGVALRRVPGTGVCLCACAEGAGAVGCGGGRRRAGAFGAAFLPGAAEEISPGGIVVVRSSTDSHDCLLISAIGSAYQCRRVSLLVAFVIYYLEMEMEDDKTRPDRAGAEADPRQKLAGATRSVHILAPLSLFSSLLLSVRSCSLPPSPSTRALLESASPSSTPYLQTDFHCAYEPLIPLSHLPLPPPRMGSGLVQPHLFQ